MKLNKIILPLLIALVAMGATTGCFKKNPKTTMIHGPNGPGNIVDPNSPLTLPPGGQLPGSEPTTGGDKPLQIGGGPQNQNWTIEQCDQDRTTFANQTVHFAFDSAAVLTKEESKLIIVSKKLKSDASAKLLIEGHCDERGTEEYNRALGERRALALREALIRSGIDAERVQTISYGKDKPADTGHDEAAWNKNRRGEFILCHLKAGA